MTYALTAISMPSVATALPTDRQRVLDLLLGDDGPLDTFVTERRARKPKRSWRLIALDIRDLTGVDVTYEALRSWFPDE